MRTCIDENTSPLEAYKLVEAREFRIGDLIQAIQDEQDCYPTSEWLMERVFKYYGVPEDEDETKNSAGFCRDYLVDALVSFVLGDISKRKVEAEFKNATNQKKIWAKEWKREKNLK